MMTTTSWRFTALEFLLAWESVGRDRLPFPLVFRGGPKLRTDFEVERRNAAIAVHDRMDENMHRALSTLAEPLARVEICGFDGPERTQMMRVHGGIGNVVGAVAAQLPGPTFEEGGDVILSLHNAANTTARLVEVLPQVDAGRTRGVVVDRRDLGHQDSAPRSYMQETNFVGHDEEAKQFFDRPYFTYGEVTVDSGPAYDGRKDESGRTFQFVDYVGDGRYLVRQGRSIAAIPATPQTLAGEIRRLTDFALRS